jgi:hypothetical protein
MKRNLAILFVLFSIVTACATAPHRSPTTGQRVKEGAGIIGLFFGVGYWQSELETLYPECQKVGKEVYENTPNFEEGVHEGHKAFMKCIEDIDRKEGRLK